MDSKSKRIVFEWPDYWTVQGDLDLYVFLEVVSALLPSGSFLYFEGPSAPEVVELLRRYARRDPPAVECGTRGHAAFHCPVDPRFLAILVEVADRHAEPEIASHILAYRGEEPLLRWYDMPSDPIFLSPSISEAAVARFAEAIGGSYTFDSASAPALSLRERVREITERARNRLFRRDRKT